MADRDERELERKAAEGDVDAARALEAARSRRGEGSLAVISDVHGNLEALQAVLADIDAQGIREVVCLGGFVAYGPNPVEVIDLLRERCAVVLRGSYEHSLLDGGGAPDYVANPFSLRLGESLGSARDVLRPGLLSGRRRRVRWRWLESLPDRHERDGVLFVHGRGDSPLWGHVPYLSPPDRDQLASCMGGAERLVAGYLAVPCAFGEGRWEPAVDLGGEVRLGEELRGACVGSVGQPRDKDTRACYAVLRGDRLRWRRVAYDVEAVATKLEGLDVPRRVFASRLRMGI